MKVGLVVPQFGINATKENLVRFVQIAEQLILLSYLLLVFIL